MPRFQLLKKKLKKNILNCRRHSAKDKYSHLLAWLSCYQPNQKCSRDRLQHGEDTIGIISQLGKFITFKLHLMQSNSRLRGNYFDKSKIHLNWAEMQRYKKKNTLNILQKTHTHIYWQTTEHEEQWAVKYWLSSYNTNWIQTKKRLAELRYPVLFRGCLYFWISINYQQCSWQSPRFRWMRLCRGRWSRSSPMELN